MRSLLTRTGGFRDEAAFTIIEVLVAALILVVASMALFGVLTSAARNGQRAKATQVAEDQAQQEIEKLHSLSYEQLAMTVTPSRSTNPKNPNYRVVSGTLALQSEPPSEYAPMVVNGGSLYGGGNVEGGVVTPGPFPFESGDVKGELYRYVVWRDDPTCKESTVAAEDYCPGNQDFKQIVVAVKLDTPGNQSYESKYVEVQSESINPKTLNEPIEEPGKSGEPGGHTGSAVTGQQFFLSDTPCAKTGTTERQEIEGDHLLHNTLGTCASGLRTGSTIGAPDALLLGAPPDPDPVDVTNPPLYDYASDVEPVSPSPETDKGVQINRDDTSGCHFTPTGTVQPASQAHRWVTDKLAEEFKMTGKVTLEFYTRTLNDALFHGTLCVYLFKRHETGPTEKPEAADSILKDKNGKGVAYWKYTPQGNGYWPRNSWTKVRLTMEFEGAPYTIPAGDRLGVALTVDGESDPGAIPIVYDHPNYPTRIEVDTTTPIEGG